MSNKNGSDSSREIFRFSFSKKTHQDVIDAIESVPRPFRSEFVARAVRYLVSNMNTVFTEKYPESHYASGSKQKHVEKTEEGLDISKTFTF